MTLRTPRSAAGRRSCTTRLAASTPSASTHRQGAEHERAHRNSLTQGTRRSCPPKGSIPDKLRYLNAGDTPAARQNLAPNACPARPWRRHPRPPMFSSAPPALRILSPATSPKYPQVAEGCLRFAAPGAGSHRVQNRGYRCDARTGRRCHRRPRKASALGSVGSSSTAPSSTALVTASTVIRA